MIAFVKGNRFSGPRSEATPEAAAQEKGRGERGGRPRSPSAMSNPRARISAFGLHCFALSHRIASQFDAMRIVHQPVQDAIGHSRIADLFVPVRHGHL